MHVLPPLELHYVYRDCYSLIAPCHVFCAVIMVMSMNVVCIPWHFYCTEQYKQQSEHLDFTVSNVNVSVTIV